MEKLSYPYIDGMESISVSVYFCKISTGGLNRNMRTGYRANDAGELTICIKFLLSCLNVHFSLGKFYILLVWWCYYITYSMNNAISTRCTNSYKVGSDSLWKHPVAKYRMVTSSCSIGVILVPLFTCSASSLCLISPSNLRISVFVNPNLSKDSFSS